MPRLEALCLFIYFLLWVSCLLFFFEKTKRERRKSFWWSKKWEFKSLLKKQQITRSIFFFANIYADDHNDYLLILSGCLWKDTKKETLQSRFHKKEKKKGNLFPSWTRTEDEPLRGLWILPHPRLFIFYFFILFVKSIVLPHTQERKKNLTHPVGLEFSLFFVFLFFF